MENAPADLVRLDDPAANRDLYYSKIGDALRNLAPAANADYELRVEDVDFTTPDPADFGRAELKRRRLKASSMTFPVKGRYRLYDRKSGGLVGESGVKTLMRVPWINEDGSMLRGGVAIAPLNQARLLPSVYHRITADGHPEAQFNSAPGTGQSFRAWLDKSTGVFNLQDGGRKLPLYHVLRDMGVDDAVLEDAWGKGVLDENRDSKMSTRYNEWREQANASGAVNRMRAAGMMPKKADAIPDEYARDTQANLLAYFGRAQFDPEATEATLGSPHPNATPATFVASTRKLLNINRGVEETDDRDSLQFQTIFDMGDVLADKIRRDQGGVLRNTLWKLAGKWANDVSKIPSGLLDEHIKTYFNGSGLVQNVDQVNPYEVFNHVQRLVRLGEGGISSMEAVPKEARNVIPSYLGFVDPIRSPECMPAEALIATECGWIQACDLDSGHKIACLVNDSVEFRTAYEVYSYDFDGELIGASFGQTSFKVTPDHRLFGIFETAKSHSDTNADAGFIYAHQARGTTAKFFCSETPKELNACSMEETTAPSWHTSRYLGKVYCASVPGCRLFIKMPGDALGHWTGNSLKVGVDSFISRDVAKGRDGQFYKQFINSRTGETEWLGMRKASRSVIGIPDYDSRPGDEFIPAMVRGKQIEYVKRTDVDYELRNGDDMFSAGGLSVPMLGQIKGKRYAMGSKYLSHSLPLENREVPLVQSETADGRPYAEFLGEKGGIVKGDVDGTVKSVSRDAIVVSGAAGDKIFELHDDYPMARKTRLSNIPQVTVGQKVKAGQLLASSNYTDDKGRMAIGLNLRALYAPYLGRNFEDGIVISDEAAKKLVSNMMYTYASPTSGGAETSFGKYRTLFPGKYDDKQMAAVDDKGIVKIGTVLKQGDPMILAHTFERPALSSMGAPRHLDNAVEWDHESPGVVTAVEKTEDGGYNVAVKSNDAFRLGDKLALAFGNKGVCSRVVPVERMPHDSEGNAVDIILNPLGVISRVNTAQVVAAALGKVAAKTGKPYVLPAFANKDMAEFAIAEAKKHGVKLEEDVYDPILKATLPNMFVGNVYTYRLQQTAEVGSHSRGTAGYTLDETPSRGGHEGSKHIGDAEEHALLAAGAQEVIKDAKLIRGQANPDFWREVRAGRVPRLPGNTAVREKFRSLVRGAGVNYDISPDGAHSLFAMTNDDVKTLTADRKITTADTFDGKTYKPIPGGMFDEAATGSANLGESFAYYETPEPLLNPMMEPVARSLLGVTKNDLMRIVSGDVEYKGVRGGEALKQMLAQIDPDATASRALSDVKDGKTSHRDAALKRLGFVRALQRKGVSPDQFMLDRIPVVPPKYRPIMETGDRVMVSDLNYLYKKYVDAVQDFHDSKELGDDAVKSARVSVYRTFKAITGMEDPEDPELQKKKVGGVLDLMLGKDSPKMGFSMRKLIGTDVDMTGLGVAIPDPDLRLDQLGVPETRLWDMYRNFIIRRMRQNGMPAASALQSFKTHDDTARAAMLAETKLRPMLLNRAPTLHRYSISAVWPVPVEGEAVRVNPAIVKPFTLDFDGDKVSYMIPASDKAVRSAVRNLTPGANLIGVRSMGPNYVPQQEYLLGLHTLSKEPDNKQPVRFATADAAIAAYQSGKIGPSDPVLVG